MNFEGLVSLNMVFALAAVPLIVFVQRLCLLELFEAVIQTNARSVFLLVFNSCLTFFLFLLLTFDLFVWFLWFEWWWIWQIAEELIVDALVPCEVDTEFFSLIVLRWTEQWLICFMVVQFQAVFDRVSINVRDHAVLAAGLLAVHAGAVLVLTCLPEGQLVWHVINVEVFVGLVFYLVNEAWEAQFECNFVW